MKRVKFIWDFRGPSALNTAKHHTIHLDEFCQLEKLSSTETGYEHLDDFHSLAFLIAEDRHLELIRDRLRPHRAVRT